MYSLYRVKPEELDAKFLESLKALFQGKEITIMIESAQDDETTYLLSNIRTRDELLAAITDVSNKTRFQTLTLNELQALAGCA